MPTVAGVQTAIPAARDGDAPLLHVDVSRGAHLGRPRQEEHRSTPAADTMVITPTLSYPTGRQPQEAAISRCLMRLSKNYVKLFSMSTRIFANWPRPPNPGYCKLGLASASGSLARASGPLARVSGLLARDSDGLARVNESLARDSELLARIREPLARVNGLSERASE